MKRADTSRRFLIFGGSCYYPGGGTSSCICSVDTLKQAMFIVKSSTLPYAGTKTGYWEIYDQKERKVVWEAEDFPYWSSSDMLTAIERELETSR